MVKIGVISDIHANIDALDAVISEMKDRSINHILCSGDIVGYHTFPDETVHRLREIGATCIRGNHDNDVVNKMFNITKSPDIFRFTYDSLSDESLAWLESLPFTCESRFESVSIKVVHGSPEDIEEYLFEGGANSRSYAETCVHDVLIAGHTHFPWVEQIGSTLFINSGSVGKPKIGRPVATWAEICIDGASVSAAIREVSYDVERMATAAENEGFERYAASLRTGKA